MKCRWAPAVVFGDGGLVDNEHLILSVRHAEAHQYIDGIQCVQHNEDYGRGRVPRAVHVHINLKLSPLASTETLLIVLVILQDCRPPKLWH